eukprot:6197522-Amphidinium_carterae.1
MECQAKSRSCGPCGGTYGILYPCMLCSNWTNLCCAYSAEGGLICASHVAILDCTEGLMVVISDPGKRMTGTILRPTKRMPNVARCKNDDRRVLSIRQFHQRQPRGSGWPSTNQFGWQLDWNTEQDASKQALKKDEKRGSIERITYPGPRTGNAPYLGITDKRRLYRAVHVETLTAFVALQNETLMRARELPTDTANQLTGMEKRKIKFHHLGHQFWRTPKTKVTEVLGKLDLDPKKIEDFLDMTVVSAIKQVEFPDNMGRSPYLELASACSQDQALAYQHIVAQELARKAYEMDHNFATPEPTLLHKLVTPTTEPYNCGPEWPYRDVQVARASTIQYNQMNLCQRKLRIDRETASSGSRAEEGQGLNVPTTISSGSRAEEYQSLEAPTMLSSGSRAEEGHLSASSSTARPKLHNQFSKRR